MLVSSPVSLTLPKPSALLASAVRRVLFLISFFLFFYLSDWNSTVRYEWVGTRYRTLLLCSAAILLSGLHFWRPPPSPRSKLCSTRYLGWGQLKKNAYPAVIQVPDPECFEKFDLESFSSLIFSNFNFVCTLQCVQCACYEYFSLCYLIFIITFSLLVFCTKVRNIFLVALLCCRKSLYWS